MASTMVWFKPASLRTLSNLFGSLNKHLRTTCPVHVWRGECRCGGESACVHVWRGVCMCGGESACGEGRVHVWRGECRDNEHDTNVL